ncbi:hypothetical protein CKO51_31085 [Rhodopirellula sp. SM50]|nr:hypothetical protein CKO51_31085 [Rhodopirellula sp. SM50]
MVLCGCGEPAAPTLHLTIKRDNGTSSVSRFRVFSTGRITESGDRGSDGGSVAESVTIDKIADDGITLTITLVANIPNAPADESKQQIFVPYGTEVTVVDLKDAALTARLERHKKK